MTKLYSANLAYNLVLSFLRRLQSLLFEPLTHSLTRLGHKMLSLLTHALKPIGQFSRVVCSRLEVAWTTIRKEHYSFFSNFSKRIAGDSRGDVNHVESSFTTVYNPLYVSLPSPRSSLRCCFPRPLTITKDVATEKR